MTLELLNEKEETLDTQTIDFPLESVVVNGEYENENIILTLQNGNKITIPIGDIINGLVSQETFNEKVAELEGKIKECVTQESFDESQEKQDTEISKLQQENNMLKGLLPTVSGKGTDVTLKGTGEAEFKKFEIEGNSVQESRSGKNIAKINETDFKLTESNTIKNKTKTTGQSVAKINLKEGQTVYINLKLISRPTEDTTFTVKVNGKVSDPRIDFNGLHREDITPLNTIIKKTYTATSDTEIELFSWGNANNDTYEFQLWASIDEELAEYEPYGAKPSPEFQSPIRNVGDNVNLFDKNNVTDGYLNATGSIVTNSNFVVSDFIELDRARSEITISGNNRGSEIGCFYDNNKEFISSFNLLTNKTLTVKIPSNAYYVRVTVRKTVLDVYKLEYGTKATSYSEYGCGNLNIDVCNKNLFDGKVEQGDINTDTGENGTNTNADYARTINYLGINKTNIAIQYNVKDSSFSKFQIVLYMYDKNKKYLGFKAQSAKSYTFNADEGTKYIRVRFALPSIDIDTFDNAQIEYDSITEYVSHKEQKSTFPLEQGQVLHIGDYLASDGIHQVRKTREFDGTEGWALVNVGAGQFNLKIEDMKSSSSLLCSHFKSKTSYSAEGKPYIRSGSNNMLWAELGTEFLPEVTVEAWKQYLAQQKEAGTPVMLEYELDEEITIPYTEEQQQAYDEIMEMTSYEDTTHVFSEDKISPIFDITAYAKGVNIVQEQTIQSEPTLEPPSYDNQMDEPSYEEDVEDEEVV